MLWAMSTCSLVVLPDPGSTLRADLVAALLATSTPILDLARVDAGPAPLASAICAAIRDARLAHPLLIIATGAAMPLLPAVARAQRAAHHLTCGYVLLGVDAKALEADPTGESWPDAPVTLIEISVGEAAHDVHDLHDLHDVHDVHDGDDADGTEVGGAVSSHARLRGWTVQTAQRPAALARTLLALAADLAP